MGFFGKLSVVCAAATLVGLGCNTDHEDPCLAGVTKELSCANVSPAELALLLQHESYVPFFDYCRSHEEYACAMECIADASCEELNAPTVSECPSGPLPDCMSDCVGQYRCDG